MGRDLAIKLRSKKSNVLYYRSVTERREIILNFKDKQEEVQSCVLKKSHRGAGIRERGRLGNELLGRTALFCPGLDLRLT
jgi:hypothetical protein